MKTTTSILTLLSTFELTLAVDYFSAIAARSASPIHLREVTANGFNFWIGKPTASFCPADVQQQGGCPPGDVTIFQGGRDVLGLGTIVPGGQEVYVAPSGALSYTEAHSGFIPTGSITTGFSKSEGAEFGVLSWTGGFVACPTNGTDGPYQVFGQRLDVTLPSNCLGFDVLTSNGTAPGAWQYV